MRFLDLTPHAIDPGAVTLRGVLGPNALLVAVVATGVALDTAITLHFQSVIGDLYAAIAPELELSKELDPPVASHDLPPPPVAPTLKLSRDRVALDVKPVGLVSALDHGDLDAVLLNDLSHRLAESPATIDPPLLVIADRTTTTKTLLAALRIARRTGVAKAGILYTRGAAPVFHADDPPEAAYSVPSDFGMTLVTLADCPAIATDWSTLAPNEVVCVGAVPGAPVDRASPSAPEAKAAESFFPCRETKRALVRPPKDDVCVEGLTPWCATDGTQVACCKEGMVARTRDGTCGCPPGGVPADSPVAGCAQSTESFKANGVFGRLDPAVIQRVVRSNFEELRACNKSVGKLGTTDSGRLKVHFEIDADGKVFFARIQDTTLTNPDAQACMLDEFRQFRFPPPAGGVVTVVYPIIIVPDDE